MAINVSRTFTSLGKLCGALNETNTFRGTCDTRQTTLITQFGTVAAYGPLVSGVYNTITAAKGAQDAYLSELGSLTDSILINEVKADRPLVSEDRETALAELKRQMAISADTLVECPCTVTVAAVGSPVGDHQFVVARYEGATGRISDFMVPDVYLIQCSADRSNGGTAYAETFSVVGKPADALPTDAAYPSGTGLSTSLTSIDPATDGGLVTDGNFPNWTVANTPDAPWSIFAGVAGTSIFKVLDNPRGSGQALRLFGAGGIVLRVRQAVTVTALTAYTAHFRVKKVADPGTDWAVSIRLVDGAGAAITGPASYSNVISSAACTSLTSDWLNPVTGQFVTPAVLPASGVYVEIVLAQSGAIATAPAAGADAYVSHVAVHEAVPLYEGGMGINCYSGVTEGVLNDTRTADVALVSGTIGSYLIRGIDRLLGGGLAASATRLTTTTSGAATVSNALVV